MFNSEEYIVETLNSVMSQTYQNWECIIIDDGSTDNSSTIVLNYCGEDTRFIYYKQKNAGPSKARNTGLKYAVGNYIQFLDADDVILPKRFETMISVYEKTEDNVILYSDILTGNNDNIYDTEIFHKSTTLGEDLDGHLLYKNFGVILSFIPGSILFKKEIFDDLFWDESLSFSEDWELYIRIALNKKQVFRNLPEKLFIYRNTNNSLSKNSKKVIISNYIIMYKYINVLNLSTYLNRVSLLTYKNILHIRHRRMKSLVMPFMLNGRFKMGAFLLLLLLPIYLLKTILIKKKLL